MKALTLFDLPTQPRRRRQPSKAKAKAPHPLAGELPDLGCAEGLMSYRLTYEARPWTLNVERQGNRWKRAKLVAEWRPAFQRLALDAKVPAVSAIAVTARPELRHGGSVPDTAACVGAAKAAIDGLVDAHVLPDDGPQYVRRLTFEAPIVTGRDALTLDVEVLA